jgi:hypothetical protein
LISRGHRFSELKERYTLPQIRLFGEAAELNRRRWVFDQAAAVSLGIRDALGKDGKLLTLWLEQGESGSETPEPESPKLNPEVLAWLTRLPVKK